ncbi:UNVERIFIED_CONTAM: hypothetical protein Sindi_2880700 [Sesamum indicum]
MSKNSLTVILEANKFNETNYIDWIQNLRIVLDFENQTYVLDRSLPRALPKGSTCEEHLTFEKWHVDNREIHSISVYAVLDRHIRYVVTKAFFSAKMIEGSSVPEHGIRILSLVKKLKDLTADHEKETYIDVILQFLPPSFDLFIVNYNMNGLDKDLHELINMLVKYEVTIGKSTPEVLVGEALTLEAKGKGSDVGGGRKVRQNHLLQALRVLLFPTGYGKREEEGGSAVVVPKDIFIDCHEKGQSKRKCSLYNQAVQLISANGLQVVKKSKRLRQTVVKLSNCRAVATVVLRQDRLGY